MPGIAARDSTASATFSSKPLVTTTSASTSTCQPVSLEVRRAFWPRFPIANESWSSLTIILTRGLTSSISNAFNCAGARAQRLLLALVRGPGGEPDDVEGGADAAVGIGKALTVDLRHAQHGGTARRGAAALEQEIG